MHVVLEKYFFQYFSNNSEAFFEVISSFLTLINVCQTSSIIHIIIWLHFHKLIIRHQYDYMYILPLVYILFYGITLTYENKLLLSCLILPAEYEKLRGNMSFRYKSIRCHVWSYMSSNYRFYRLCCHFGIFRRVESGVCNSLGWMWCVVFLIITDK